MRSKVSATVSPSPIAVPSVATALLPIMAAFLDVALGFGSPVLGWIAGWSGLGSVFLAGALIVFGATAFAMRLLWRTEVT
jgi:hypothetical protein